MVAGAKNIYSKGGFRAFYLGNGVNCTKVAPETAFKMHAFDQFKTLGNY
jgi:solute carrier family 25 phosphate transporter 23/24/25/41